MGLFSKKKDNSEKNEREINEYLTKRMMELAEIRKSADEVIAEEVRQERQAEECRTQIERSQGLAEKAVQAGNEADTRVFLKKKYELEQHLAVLEENHRQAAAAADNIKAAHDAMVREINDLRTRLKLLKTRSAAADAQNTFYSTYGSVDDEFSEMEYSADMRAAHAEAQKYAHISDDDRLTEEIENLAKQQGVTLEKDSALAQELGASADE